MEKKITRTQKNAMRFDVLGLPKKQQTILKQLYAKHPGTYFKIQYYTDVNKSVSAHYKSQYNVTKLTTMSVRIGISYDKTKRVLERRMQLGYVPSSRESWYYHIDKILLKHRSLKQYYIGVFPNINGKPETIYMINGVPVNYEQLKELGIMQPSFWKHKEKPEFMTIGLDKIVTVY